MRELDVLHQEESNTSRVKKPSGDEPEQPGDVHIGHHRMNRHTDEPPHDDINGSTDPIKPWKQNGLHHHTEKGEAPDYTQQ